jgi:uncharacterized protein YgiM (DUF1202 family)
VTIRWADGSTVQGINIVVGGPYNLNVRAATSVESAKLTMLAVGTVIPAIGRTVDNTWLQVVLPSGRMGWVYRETAGVSVAVIASLPEVYTPPP